MNLLPVFARRKPTTDDVARRYMPARQLARRRDTDVNGAGGKTADPFSVVFGAMGTSPNRAMRCCARERTLGV